MLMNHSIPTVVPLGRVLIGVIQTHIQAAEEVGEAQV